MSYRIREYQVIADGSTQVGTIAQEVARDHSDIVHEGKQFLTVDQVNPWKLVKGLQEVKTDSDRAILELKADNDNLRAATWPARSSKSKAS